MKSGLLRVPVTNNDTVLGDAQFSKSSTFASSARLLCSFSLILRVARFGLEVCGELGAAGWTRTDGGLAPGPTSTTGPDPNQAPSAMGPWQPEIFSCCRFIIDALHYPYLIQSLFGVFFSKPWVQRP